MTAAGGEMHNTREIDSDGTVEISDTVYRCLVGALQEIAAGSSSCCVEHKARRNKHSPSCAVGIARAAFREADRLNALPNAILDRPHDD
jgi:hypothetical protein